MANSSVPQASRGEDGVKKRYDASYRDPAAPYKDWHRTLGKDMYMSDADSIEWRKRSDGTFEAVGVIELTSVNGEVNADKLGDVEKRFRTQLQGIHLFLLAEALRCNAYVLAMDKACEDLWATNWTRCDGIWKRFTRDTWARHLKNLAVRSPTEGINDVPEKLLHAKVRVQQR